MDAIRDIVHLGGYGLYVWPAYGAAIAILAWMAVSTLARLRTTERTLETLQNTRATAAAPGSDEGNMSGGGAGAGAGS